MTSAGKSSQRTLLGFDFGLKRIGVAVGQELTGTAQALCTLSVKNKQIPWQEVSRLIEQWQPDALVLGLPLNKDNTEHDITRAARRFGNRLNGRYNLPVYWVDERLTSFAAEQLINEKSAKPGSIDSVAAQLILESWLQNPATNDVTSPAQNRDG